MLRKREWGFDYEELGRKRKGKEKETEWHKESVWKGGTWRLRRFDCLVHMMSIWVSLMLMCVYLLRTMFTTLNKEDVSVVVNAS